MPQVTRVDHGTTHGLSYYKAYAVVGRIHSGQKVNSCRQPDAAALRRVRTSFAAECRHSPTRQQKFKREQGGSGFMLANKDDVPTAKC